MKKQSTLLLAALLVPAAAMAQSSECIKQPTCTELGYSQTINQCLEKNLPYIRCPFDTNAVFCGKAAKEQIEQTKPQVGDLKYSLYSSNHDGWLRCDGSQYSITTYKNLYNVIGTNFCRTYSSRTSEGTTGQCDSGRFAVPDYRGFFLRGYKYANSNAVDKLTSINWPNVSNALYYKGNYFRYGGSSGSVSDSFYIPEYERLPNITGYFYTGRSEAVTLNSWMGAFSKTAQSGYWANRESSSDGGRYEFNASKSNSIYDGGHVVPANYAAHIYIYAGQ